MAGDLEDFCAPLSDVLEVTRASTVLRGLGGRLSRTPLDPATHDLLRRYLAGPVDQALQAQDRLRQIEPSDPAT